MIELNPALDATGLAPLYGERKRLQVRDFFAEPSAEEILAALEKGTPWGLAFMVGTRVAQMTVEDMARLTPAQRSQLMAEIHEQARTGFQFLYQHYSLSTAYFTPGAPRTKLFELYEFLNSPTFLDFMREMTGLRSIRWADAHATLYGAGHFLKYHTDESKTERRLAAYVLNFTKGWGRDWGGYLQFFNERYEIEEGYRPVFNALNIFTIPADHSVSMVATYAPGRRYSVTGWLREDDAPGLIGGR